MSEQLTGRELDAAVAKALGWAFVDAAEGVGIPTAEVERAMNDISVQADDIHFAIAPAYSATWAGLGLVVEEMERKGWTWQVTNIRVVFAQRHDNGPPVIVEHLRSPFLRVELDVATTTARAALSALEEVSDE